jgi:hypothetical protein
MDCSKVKIKVKRSEGALDKSAEMQKDREDETDAISGRPWCQIIEINQSKSSFLKWGFGGGRPSAFTEAQ